ncbi:MAG TPA: galactose oxidase early set domain-containing protein [Longimicrobium sp.]|nr:galactose oxidase early set domain-containing protein [Longimicrobium sp.]
MPWHPSAADPLIQSQILSVHAALIPRGPRGAVLMLGGSEHNPAQGGTDDMPADPANVDRAALYDVDAGTDAVRIASPTTDVFCSGHAYVGDGRLLIGGGTESWGGEEGDMAPHGHVHDHGNFGGHRACWVFNHRRESWDRAADFNFEVGPGLGGGRWYPSLVTLPSGDVVAFGGHPSRKSMEYHENSVPERYHYRANAWTWYPDPVHFDHSVYPGNWYPRITLVTGGWIFLTTHHFGESRLFDPETGGLVGPAIPGLSAAPYAQGWDYGVLPMPLLPGDEYRTRVMAVNGVNAFFVDLDLSAGAPVPAWKRAGNRTGSAEGKSRRFACPVYLPTGQILVTGGINGSDDDQAVRTPELFTPDIDWTALTYNPPGPGEQIEDTIGTWQTIEEEARVARNYHSVALLLPDGSVFTSGSNIDAAAGNPATKGQLNIEIYRPAYFADPGRPVLANAPALLTYADQAFTATAGSVAQAASIRGVALVRCGSVTHAGDFDQRYVALAFEHLAGTADLRVTLPRDASVTPPGYYMLWMVNDAGLPCQVARFVRMAHVGCQLFTDRDTFSREEVLSFAPADAVFPFAVYAVYDGFLPGELAGTPVVELRWADDDVPVPAADIRLVPSGARWLEHPPEWEEVAQRITYPFTVEIRNPAIFDGFADRRTVRMTVALAGQSCTETLVLANKPNPYMVDVDPVRQNPHWVSTDIRTFRVRPGDTMLGSVTHGSGAEAPRTFLRALIDRLGTFPNDESHPFLDLPHEGDAAAVDLAPFDGAKRVYNYAVAKVRYRATTTHATNVKVFFRLCTTAATGLEYNTATVYAHSGPGAGTVPLLGRAGGEVASIPFFLAPRVETRTGFPGAASMTTQPLEAGYDVQTIIPTAGQEITAFFGCWLDINDPDTDRFPLLGSGNGPWEADACQPVQSFFRSPHQCMVAEVYFEDDPTAPGETPGSSDNLSQRNLLFLHSDNPGGPDSHHVLHPFEVKPSTLPKLALAAAGALANLANKRRVGPDELLFRWHNLPRDSEVTLYFSDVDTAEIQRMATVFRHSPAAFQVVDPHTVRLGVAGGTWLPLPGGRTLNIPALLSVRLPDDVVYGQEFRITVHQVNGFTGRVTGSFQVTIPVRHAEMIVERETRTLSIMKHIATTIPTANRWYPIFQRYLHGLSLRVDALGGDAGAVHANPDGSGRPYTPPAHRPAERPVERPCVEGWAVSLVLALALLLAGASPSRAMAVVAGVAGAVLLAGAVSWWRRRCCGRIRCALLDHLALGSAAAAAGLAVLFLAGLRAPLLGGMMLLAVLLTALFVIGAFTAGCRNRCCDDPGARC